MQALTMKSYEVVLGVDTHLDTHVGVVLSGARNLLGTLTIPVSTKGYRQLLAWAMSYGDLRRAGAEGTGTYGAGLTRLLREHDIEVLEVNRPDRAARRFQGKSAPTDAESAARAVLSGKATAIPKTQSGVAESMRAVLVARRSAVKARTQAINQVKALLISAPQPLRERLWRNKPAECFAGCLRLREKATHPLQA